MDNTIALIEGIPAGKSVYTGYANGTCTAPSKPGTYTLYDVVNQECYEHRTWRWKPEEPTGKAMATYDQMKVEE